MKSIALILPLLLLSTAAVGANCSADRATIMILGTYHFDNPGQDAVNLQADDVLSARRQTELDDVVEKIARYKPTKIAIEAPYRNATWPDRYQQFVAGTYTPGRNEIEQIGFRLAKRLKLPAIYPVDFPMWMNGWTPSEMELPREKANAKWDAEAKKGSDAKNAPQAAAPARPLSAEDELLRKLSVREYLLRLNSAEMIEKNHANYMKMLLPSKSVGIYEQTDSVTNWYKRNLRIFTNLNRITDFPGDRILLLIGAGHLRILKGFAADSPYFCLEDSTTVLQ